MKIEIPKGYTIWCAAELAVKKAKEIQAYVKFDFNETEIEVHWMSWPDDIARIYNLLHKIRMLESGKE